MYKIEYKLIDYSGETDLKAKRMIEHNTAHALLNKMLLDFNISSPVFLKNENGKPYIEGEDVHFSISHTEGLALCVVADSPVGVDAELITGRDREYIEKFANRYFVENEIKMLAESDFCEVVFLQIWTGKEATIKKHGYNMSYVKKIDVTKENIRFFNENGYIISINV
ncbi:MAG: 4'-phosphopantetheinyl transferase superfamily protein [Clostridia bacterium]|nr:4'-phosphopantetheinyl transferase superfamily protein [Clostridia bacterium]